MSPDIQRESSLRQKMCARFQGCHGNVHKDKIKRKRPEGFFLGIFGDLIS